jgi:maltooligosyltrehalose trehalohydrolase
LRLLSNFSDEVVRTAMPAGQTVFASTAAAGKGELGPCEVVWMLQLPSPAGAPAGIVLERG